MASIRNALRHLGFDFIELTSGPLPDPSNHIFILPGVGSFSNASLSLKNRGFDLLSSISPRLIGICLGMQLLFSDSTEGSLSTGLSLIPGNVRSISDYITANSSIKIPHVGWQSLFCDQNKMELLDDYLHRDFYFVHSYMAVNIPSENLLATVRYGDISIPSVVLNNSVIGFQFHPGKKWS